MLIDTRYFKLVGKNRKSRHFLVEKGKEWHVEEEKFFIKRFGEPGYILRSTDGTVMCIRKAQDQDYRISEEFFRQVDLIEIVDEHLHDRSQESGN